MTRSLLAILAVVLVIAAPRPAHPVIPADRPALRGASNPQSSGNLAGRTEALREDSRVLPISGRDRQAGKLDGASPSSPALASGAGSERSSDRTTSMPAIKTGWATWCGPTPTRCQSWGGDAMLGAVRSFRWGDEPYTVQVCGFRDGSTNCVLVTIVSYCACGDRDGIPTVIDLSPRAFRSLAPLHIGRVRVEVDGIRPKSKRPRITLPPTDSEGGTP